MGNNKSTCICEGRIKHKRICYSNEHQCICNSKKKVTYFFGSIWIGENFYIKSCKAARHICVCKKKHSESLYCSGRMCHRVAYMSTYCRGEEHPCVCSSLASSEPKICHFDDSDNYVVCQSNNHRCICRELPRALNVKKSCNSGHKSKLKCMVNGDHPCICSLLCRYSLNKDLCQSEYHI